MNSMDRLPTFLEANDNSDAGYGLAVPIRIGIMEDDEGSEAQMERP